MGENLTRFITVRVLPRAGSLEKMQRGRELGPAASQEGPGRVMFSGWSLGSALHKLSCEERVVRKGGKVQGAH